MCIRCSNVDSGGPKEAQVQLYSSGGAIVPSHAGTLASPGKYHADVVILVICAENQLTDKCSSWLFCTIYFKLLQFHSCIPTSLLLTALEFLRMLPVFAVGRR